MDGSTQLVSSVRIAAPLKAAWEAAVNDCSIERDKIAGLVDAFRSYGPEGVRDAADDSVLGDVLFASVVMCRVAFVHPECGIPVFDRLADDYLDGAPFSFSTRELGDEIERELAAPGVLNPGFLPALWNLVEGGVLPESITLNVAALGAFHPASLRDASARAMHQHQGFEEFLARDPLPRLTLEMIEKRSEGSIGHSLYRMIVDNNYDLEVLDPELVADYHPVHDNPNRYILQAHEIWHLAAGYSTSPLHEVSISGFQFAQFGHPYSRDFLASIGTLTALTNPAAAPFFVQLSLEGWRHGRATPPLTLVDWYEHWDDSIEDIRRSVGIEPYRSAIPDIPLPV